MVKEHFAVMVEITLQAERAFVFESPTFFRKANTDLENRPRALASMVSKMALQGEDVLLLMSRHKW
jgi:hypothetical protein